MISHFRENSAMSRHGRFFTAAGIVISIALSSPLIADDLGIGLQFDHPDAELGESIPFTLGYATREKIPLEANDPRFAKAKLVVDLYPSFYFHRELNVHGAAKEALTPADSNDQYNAGVPLPQVAITAKKQFTAKGELKFPAEDSLMPGYWPVQIEMSEQKLISNYTAVNVKAVRKSVPFIAKIVSDTKVKLYKRRRWAQFLELVDPEFNPVWPRPTDTAEVQASREAAIAVSVEELVRNWEALSDEDAELVLETLNKAGSVLALQFYAQ